MKRSRYPYQYEDTLPLHGYSEPGSDGSAHLDVEAIENPGLKRLVVETSSMKVGEILAWIEAHRVELCDGNGTSGSGAVPGLVVLTQGLNTVVELNKMLNETSQKMEKGDYLWVHTNTSGLRKTSILSGNIPVWRNILYVMWYMWYRVFPKLWMTRWLYRLNEKISGRVNRCYHRVEVLGRLFRAGFEVVDESFRHGHFFVICRKMNAPLWDNEPTGSPIIKLMRVGKGGAMIPVFKFRTMHSYSEYLQSYVYKYNKLASGGKFANDYRVAGYGKILRKFWLDELPMVINLIRLDVKLVGVRPISRQYFSLYSPQMQELRVKVKPGILPPFYYEKKRPETMEEIQESERRYTEAYLKHPFRTDWRYFWGTVGNILFRGARSK